MLPDIASDDPIGFHFGHNGTNDFAYASLGAVDYHKYVFFAVCSALLGLPCNVLLLVILIRIGLYSKRRISSVRSSYSPAKNTGSFERFLFEVVFIDTLLLLYHFMDNFLSYIQGDRSAGQHYLIHVSDFCCKFFTYIAKISVLLTTWLLLFLIINQLILSLEYRKNRRSCWNRGLYYVNAKYSTVFLVFAFSVSNIYPIEVLRYQKIEDVQDYQQEGVSGVCSTVLEGKSRRLLNASNYGYNLLGVAIPCVLILVLSIIIIYRTCRNSKHRRKECVAFYYIAGTIGILHALFNLPGRCSDILMMSLSPYVWFFPHLINFNHEAQSLVFVSYAYKFFVCILISRRFRLHAKSIMCFLIENKYEDGLTTEIGSTANDWQQFTKPKRHHRHHRPKGSFLTNIATDRSVSTKYSPPYIPPEDLHRFTTSETTAWIRPYFTRNEKRHFLRPCGRSSSCHHLASLISSSSSHDLQAADKGTTNAKDSPDFHKTTNTSSVCIVNVPLPNGECLHIPLPQKRASKF